MTTSAETYFKEGIVLHEQGKFGKALKYYTQALKINPDFDEVYEYLKPFGFKHTHTDYCLERNWGDAVFVKE